MAVATEQLASKEMDVLPGHGRYFLQQPDRLLVIGDFVPLQQGREQDAIVAMMTFAISRPHWLVIATSRSGVPISCFLPPTCGMAERSWW
jgi:hypothetical protein